MVARDDDSSVIRWLATMGRSSVAGPSLEVSDKMVVGEVMLVEDPGRTSISGASGRVAS